MKIIATKENKVNFKLYSNFENRLFLPIGKYVNWKLVNNWDDYNELYHAIKYIESLNKIDEVWYEIHTIEEKEEIKGVVTIVGGNLNKLGIKSFINEEDTLLLKYFHIVEKGKGYGSYWLKSIIIPYYSERGYNKIQVSSSHPKSFDFYRKIGTEIENYTKKSDNKLYERKCKSFLISIDEQK
ncbi:hypothetical protein GCM10011506_08740 [Marivirga lumbricoides]|uniref:N-acetyltransferase domain-containing protein n=1 Tax=Marivirga lumbricoides TaxID=1046115 RepID=A0ABQ1LPL8_9BACT|nr:hypothetical protein GCM10011506_08740 [Marivirga lumbricoides]